MMVKIISHKSKNCPAQMNSELQLHAGSILPSMTHLMNSLLTSDFLYFENVVPLNSVISRMSLISPSNFDILFYKINSSNKYLILIFKFICSYKIKIIYKYNIFNILFCRLFKRKIEKQ